jgi:hypothetical protein
MVRGPHVRSDQVRDREEHIATVSFHRAHAIELIYFSLAGAVALGTVSFWLDPQWAWFLRGIIAGIFLTFIYVLGRTMHRPTL